MKTTDESIEFRIRPYIQEAVLQIMIDMAVIALVTFVFILAKFPVIAFVAVDLVYLIVALVFHYRVAIQAIIDKRKSDYVTETIRIDKVNEEFSFAGDRLGHSYIRTFYPKEMQVGKYKLKAIDDNGENKKLRSVMSDNRLHKFSAFRKHQIDFLRVTYLKKSKIIIRFDLIEDIGENSRKKEEIEKAIRYINMSI